MERNIIKTLKIKEWEKIDKANFKPLQIGQY